jgi:hypothetical protein
MMEKVFAYGFWFAGTTGSRHLECGLSLDSRARKPFAGAEYSRQYNCSPPAF